MAQAPQLEQEQKVSNASFIIHPGHQLARSAPNGDSLSVESNGATLVLNRGERKNAEETRMTEQDLCHRIVDRNDFEKTKVVIPLPELRPGTEIEDMMLFFKNLPTQIAEDVDSFYDISPIAKPPVLTESHVPMMNHPLMQRRATAWPEFSIQGCPEEW